MKEIIIYEDEFGNEPFSKWFGNLKDVKTRNRIVKRLSKVEEGNFGDFHSVGSGVKERGFFFGSGYRIYFAEDGNTIVLLICAGDKSSQR